MATTTPIFLDSASNSSVQSGRYRSDDFTTVFTPPIILGGRQSSQGEYNDVSPEYELALIAFNAWNTIPNISASLYQNTIFTYDNSVSPGPYNVTFDDGIYSFAQMQSKISTSLVDNGFLATDIQLLPDTSINKLYIQLAANFSVDFSTSNWYQLAGFELTQSPLLASAYGNLRADITNGQDSYLIHCDAVTDSVLNSAASDVLYVYRPTSRPSSAVTIAVQNPVYVRCNRHDQYEKIRVYVTDNLNRPITYNGEDINLLLHVRRIDKPLSQNNFTNAMLSALNQFSNPSAKKLIGDISQPAQVSQTGGARRRR